MLPAATGLALEVRSGNPLLTPSRLTSSMRLGRVGTYLVAAAAGLTFAADSSNCEMLAEEN